MPVVPDGVVVDGVVVVVVVEDGLEVLLPDVSEPDDVPEPEVPLPELSVGDVDHAGVSELDEPEVLPLVPDELDGAVTPEPPLPVVPLVPVVPAPELPGVVLSVPEVPDEEVPAGLLSCVALGLLVLDPVELVPLVPLEVSDGLLPYPGDEGVDVPVLPEPEPVVVSEVPPPPDVLLVPELSLDPLPVVGVALLPEPVLKSDAPLPLLPVLEAPLVEPLAGVSVVALVPDVPELPDVPDVPDDDDAPCCSLGGFIVVVVVVVVWPNVAVAVPIRESKMARGNFFMLTPSVELRVALKLPKVFFRPEFIRRFSAPTREIFPRNFFVGALRAGGTVAR